MLLEINGLKKSVGRSSVLLKRLALYADDKLAVVGRNGSGKTTLLRLIAGEIQPDEGTVGLRGHLAVIPQLDPQPQLPQSGGERTQALIDAAFAKRPDLLLADEPTTNLDIGAIRRLESKLVAYRGALLLVSHDRTLLEAVCSKVLDIETGTLYGCGYADYLSQKQLEAATQASRYVAYAAEKSRLSRVAAEKKQQSAKIKRPPKRMGNSEARLHKMGGQSGKAKLDSAAKAARSRLEQLDIVEKPYREKEIAFDLLADTLHSPVLISVHGVSKSFGNKTVLEGCSFDVPNNTKTALIGPNGAGKTTLLEMIMSREKGIVTCAHLKIGYFKQNIGTLDLEKSVLENAMQNSVYSECFVRTVLARLHFWRDTVGTKAVNLSGGERLKLALARIMLEGFHLLMLDEPTNFLDADSRCALESVLAAYPGALLFISHDRSFIKAVADRIIFIRDGRAHTFEGGWESFLGSGAENDESLNA